MHRALLLSFLSLFLGFSPVSQAQEPLLSLAEHGVVARDVRPGAEIVWLSVGQQVHQGIPLFSSHVETLVDDDRDGTVTWSPNPELALPKLSIWVAIDPQTGWIDLVSPLALEDRLRPFPAAATGALDSKTELVGDFPLGQAVLVRPGKGAWLLDSMDGGRDDADRLVDGKVELQLATARPLGSNERPFDALRPQDRLVFLDHAKIQVGVAEVGENGVKSLFGADAAGSLDAIREGR